MIDMDSLEQSDAFLDLHGNYKTAKDAVPEIVEMFGDMEFTRSHVVSQLRLDDRFRARQLSALDETVRQIIIGMVNEGRLLKTGKKKFGRDVLRRAK